MKAYQVIEAEDRVIGYRRGFRYSAAEHLALRGSGNGYAAAMSWADARVEYRRYSAAKREAWALRCPASNSDWYDPNGTRFIQK